MNRHRYWTLTVHAFVFTGIPNIDLDFRRVYATQSENQMATLPCSVFRTSKYGFRICRYGIRRYIEWIDVDIPRYRRRDLVPQRTSITTVTWKWGTGQLFPNFLSYICIFSTNPEQTIMRIPVSPWCQICTCLVNTSTSVNLAFLHFHLIHPFLSIHPSCLSCLICLISRIHPTRIKVFCYSLLKSEE